MVWMCIREIGWECERVFFRWWVGINWATNTNTFIKSHTICLLFIVETHIMACHVFFHVYDVILYVVFFLSRAHANANPFCDVTMRTGKKCYFFANETTLNLCKLNKRKKDFIPMKNGKTSNWNVWSVKTDDISKDNLEFHIFWTQFKGWNKRIFFVHFTLITFHDMLNTFIYQVPLQKNVGVDVTHKIDRINHVDNFLDDTKKKKKQKRDEKTRDNIRQHWLKMTFT